MNLILLQILCLTITVLANAGDKSEEKPLVIFCSLVPIIGHFIAVISIGLIIHRSIQSKGRCILGHQLLQTYDSETEKWKDGRRPMRISMGGFTRYQCSCCQVEQTISWKAF